MSCIESQPHTWLGTHMFTHAHMSVCMCLHTHTPHFLLWTPCEVRSTSPPVVFCPMVSCWADISVCLDGSLTWCLFGLATCFHLNRYAAQKKEEVDFEWEWPSGASADLLWHEEHGQTMHTWRRRSGEKCISSNYACFQIMDLKQ